MENAQPEDRVHEQDEFERRWWVLEIDPAVFEGPSRFIEQAYILDGDARIRIIDNMHAEITKKTGRGKKRKERTMTVSVPLARFLMEDSKVRIAKYRHDREGFEIDRCVDAHSGIIILEFESTDYAAVEAATPPSWVKRAIEVTDTINNKILARLGEFLSDDETVDPGQLSAFVPGMAKIPGIVLTGCAGSGKSSIMNILTALEDDTTSGIGGTSLGRFIHAVPEVATIVICQVGVPPPIDSPARNREFQRNVYKVQRCFEAVSRLHAQRTGKQAIIFDRGTMDGAAYLKGGVPAFEAVIRKLRADEYARYDAVLILAPAPRDVYEREKTNNPARSETYEETLALHERIMAAWDSHPQAILIDGETWEEKVANAKAVIDRIANVLE